ncbi:MAG: cytochrome-c oxidase [Nitrospiraceae bacterium]|nr:MAG: cytochrome-c oxidase [Nitrospiraceae bacterium]
MPGPGLYFLVWLGLIALTALTVIAAGAGLGAYGALTSVSIALAKSVLILMFFMHLKYEKTLIRALLFLPVITIAVIIGLTFFDIGYRY